VVGVLLLMPFLDQYGRLISWLVPERDDPLTRYLDPSVRTIPSVGVEAARRSAIQIAGFLVRIAHATLAAGVSARPEKKGLGRAEDALRNTRSFLQEIHTSPEQPDGYQRHLSVLHAIEHLERLVTALQDWGQGIQSGDFTTDQEIALALGITLDAFEEAGYWFDAADPEQSPPDLSYRAARVADLRREHRPAVMARTAGGVDSPEAALHILDAMRIVDRTMYHLWRTMHHLGSGPPAPLPAPVATVTELEPALLD
jgi:phosphate:Na+ symporter